MFDSSETKVANFGLTRSVDEDIRGFTLDSELVWVFVKILDAVL